MTDISRYCHTAVGAADSALDFSRLLISSASYNVIFSLSLIGFIWKDILSGSSVKEMQTGVHKESGRLYFIVTLSNLYPFQ